MKNKIKSLASDTIIYGLSSILGRFLTFILTPIYTNYLTTPQYDFVIYSYSIIALLNILYVFGMETAYFRFYNFEDKEESKKVFSNSFIFISLLTCLFTIVFLIFSKPIGSAIASSELENPTFLVFLALLIPLFDLLTYIPFGFLRMSRQAKRFAITKFVIIVITVFLNFLFLIGFDMQAEGVFYAQIIGSIITVIYFIPIFKENFVFNIDNKLLKHMLKFGIPTLPASMSAIILQVADRPILKELTNSELAITTYQVNYRLGIPMMIFVTVFEYAWKPFYLSTYKEEDAKKSFARILTYFTLVSSFIFLFFSFFMEFIVKVPFIGGKLINPKYWQGLHIIPIVLLAYFFNGLYTNFTAGFIIEKKTKLLPFSVGIAAIVNIISNFILIPIYGYTGAAWSTLIAYFISAFIIYFQSRRIYPIDYEWSRIGLLILLCTIIFFISVYVIIPTIYLSVLFKIFLIIIYIFMLFIFGFFNSNEQQFIKSFIKFNRKDVKKS